LPRCLHPLPPSPARRVCSWLRRCCSST
jgi:hypothetical protein